MQAIYRQPLVQEALYVASTDLFITLERWLTDADMTDKDRDKLDLAYAKYLLRMAHRPTPFGLFAGLSVGEWANQTDLHLADLITARRHSRLDMDFLGAVVQQLARQPDIRERLLYRPNNTLYQVGNQYRYTEYRYSVAGRSHHLATVAWSPYLQTVLDRATYGATLPDLLATLVSDEITPDEARAYIDELIDGKLLVSELEPRVTDPANIERLVETLRERIPHWPGLTALEQAVYRVHQLDQTPLGGNRPSDYTAILDHLHTAGFNASPSRLFQVDWIKSLSGQTLNRAIIDEINGAVSLLADIARLVYEPPLRAFQEAFSARYEEQEIPLLNVLDTEIGLGYPLSRADSSDNTPLLDTLMVSPKTSPSVLRASAWDRYALQQHSRLLAQGATEWVIDEADLRTIVPTAAEPPLPPSLYAMARLLAPSGQAVDAGHYQVVLQGTGGPSAANLLGRFTHVDPVLAEQTRHLLEIEQQQMPEVVLAEIVYLPPAHVGNVQLRVPLRAYEIPILAAATTDDAHTLPLSDLWLSVRQNRLVLRSERLNREVVPRLSTAHNYAFNAIPAYHFLCDLQRQQQLTGLGWSWGSLLTGASFYPRVRLGRVILQPATWLLRTADFFPTHLTGDALLAHLRQVRTQKQLPRRVVYGEADNQLPIDLENSLSVSVLRGLVKHSAQFTVEESFFEPNALLISDGQGKGYTNEFVFPLHNVAVSKPAAGVSAPKKAAEVPRQFIPGSEWLYIKLYCGLKMADTLLTEVVGPLAGQLLTEGLIDRWFFIRYSDPDSHLRVRFHATQPQAGHLLSYLHTALSPYQQSGLLRAIQLDTYKRELERYGPATMEASEVLFFHDSRAVVSLLELLEGDEGDTYRWQLALLSVDKLLDDWGLPLPDKSRLMETLAGHFAQEHMLDDTTGRVQFDTHYRRLRPTVDALISRTLPADEWGEVLNLLDQRTQNWQSVIQQVKRSYVQGLATVPFHDWLASHIHMTLNRWSRSRPRQQELVIYQLLHRHYRSLLARAKQSQLTSIPT
ncbi:hypothetical protein AWR27_15200 [Spirosoma montaniterrae]|uniref:Lantibiotic dehydratase n=2 Tax=Spirosoma montaniterrae TaxID=1178516 RepID=A0A1P9WYV1_9BACT|nr:hypothetical protein AWR27_15200 [Spirosoma montaniterrae]